MKIPSTYFLSDHTIPLKDYFVFGLSIDCVVFGYHEGEIKVLLVQRDVEPFNGHWALIGDLVEPDKNLEEAANNVLEKLTGLKNIYMKQFFTFLFSAKRKVTKEKLVAVNQIVHFSSES